MYCPRCGQKASEGIRFCSRCGLPLDDALALVEAGGRLTTRDVPHEGARPLTPRQRGTRKGLLIMPGGVVFFILAALLTALKGDFFVLMLPAALVFTFGFMRGLYGLLLEEDTARRKRPELYGARDAAALPPRSSSRSASCAGCTGFCSKRTRRDVSGPNSTARATQPRSRTRARVPPRTSRDRQPTRQTCSHLRVSAKRPRLYSKRSPKALADEPAFHPDHPSLRLPAFDEHGGGAAGFARRARGAVRRRARADRRARP